MALKIDLLSVRCGNCIAWTLVAYFLHVFDDMLVIVNTYRRGNN